MRHMLTCKAAQHASGRHAAMHEKAVCLEKEAFVCWFCECVALCWQKGGFETLVLAPLKDPFWLGTSWDFQHYC